MPTEERLCEDQHTSARCASTREPQKRPDLPPPSSRTARLYDSEKISVCCLKQSVAFCYGNSSKLTQLLETLLHPIP